MGKGLTEIESPQGFAAETSSTAVLLASSHLGFPLSTTQVCSGSILGAGLGKRLAEVRWTVAGRMAMAWLFTLPAAAVVGALAGQVANSGNFGVVIDRAPRGRGRRRHLRRLAAPAGDVGERQRVPEPRPRRHHGRGAERSTAMHIDWSALGQVALVSLLFGSGWRCCSRSA